KARHEGAGLGLAAVQGFAVQSGGVVWLDHRGPGTTVCLALPLAVRSEVRAPAAGSREGGVAHPPAKGHGGTVLVAEDEPAVMTLLRRTLEEGGYTVLSGADG